jgi:hypothetical protein
MPPSARLLERLDSIVENLREPRRSRHRRHRRRLDRRTLATVSKGAARPIEQSLSALPDPSIGFLKELSWMRAHTLALIEREHKTHIREVCFEQS